MSSSRASRRASAAARHRLLPGGRLAGPMPWIIAIMMFLTVLSAAAGLALGAAVQAMSADLAGRASVQVVEADAAVRDQLAARTLQALRQASEVRAATPVDPAALADQLRPWLGEDAASADLPVPALIDVTLTPGAAEAKVDRLRRLLGSIAPSLRIEPHAAFLLPLAGLLAALGWLAVGVVVLMTVATGAVVVLAARGAHDSHRGTIDVLHLMGSTDVQIARLFQWRIGLDALLGGVLGFAFAVATLLVIGLRLDATGSDLLGAVALDRTGWALLALLPVAGVLLAVLTARWTVLRALGRAL
ncbi:cell division transport system permease protein [Sphingobium xenophagum]|uniref:Cell division transport system permease protein n=1 Tax=Sphingobium xenophagum TaxID=121428 RepID=A0ABU1X5V8_SPHXE|nr:FtsX-like permease family protein [Sphingobium xenophagum]MDR7156422.1 cell division transport system permease protein [Sphingobium xenophagum]